MWVILPQFSTFSMERLKWIDSMEIKIVLVQNPRGEEQGGTQTLGERKVKESESGETK